LGEQNVVTFLLLTRSTEFNDPNLGCGSGLIQCEGSSILAQSGSGSGSKLKQNFQRQFLSQNYLKSKFESNQIKNTGVIHQIFVSKSTVVGAILYLFSCKLFLKLKSAFFH
jgi:hypothetical protein